MKPAESANNSLTKPLRVHSWEAPVICQIVVGDKPALNLDVFAPARPRASGYSIKNRVN
jgi:hypothetical protein